MPRVSYTCMRLDYLIARLVIVITLVDCMASWIFGGSWVQGVVHT